MIERLQPTLALLDQGLSLYRRHFISFVLIAAIWFVPVAIMLGFTVAFGSRIDDGLGGLLLLLSIPVLFMLMIYLLVALSRAAGAALEGQPLQLRSLLRFEPLRLLGTTLFSIVYLIVAQIVSSMVSMMCICPIYILAVGVIGGSASIDSDRFGVFALLIFITVSIFAYAALLFFSGATYGSLIYGLQPWAQERNRFGVALQHAIDLVFYRFWRNLMTWGLASLILAAVGLVVTVTVGVVLPLPLAWAFGTEAPLIRAITAGAWLIGFVLVLPPLPIWMAMLYHRNRASREGEELPAKVEAWCKKQFAVQNPEFNIRNEPPTNN